MSSRRRQLEFGDLFVRRCHQPGGTRNLAGGPPVSSQVAVEIGPRVGYQPDPPELQPNPVGFAVVVPPLRGDDEAKPVDRGGPGGGTDRGEDTVDR